MMMKSTWFLSTLLVTIPELAVLVNGDSACSETLALQQLNFDSSSIAISEEVIKAKAERLALLHVNTTTLQPLETRIQQYQQAISELYDEHPHIVGAFIADMDAGLDWIPGQVVVNFDTQAQQEFEDGTYDDKELQQLHQSLGGLAQEEKSPFGYNYAIYHFDTPYNPLALATQYMQIPGVSSAEPNFLLGNGGLSVQVNKSEDRFTMAVGWGDCIAGCTAFYSWSFCVNADTIDQGCVRPEDVANQPCGIHSGAVTAPVRTWGIVVGIVVAWLAL